MKTSFQARLWKLSATVLALGFQAGCAGPPTNGAPKERIIYLDRNRDGRIDEEKHVASDGCDMDWSLIDTDFDGFYDRKVLYGVAVTSQLVRSPIRAGDQTLVPSPNRAYSSERSPQTLSARPGTP